MLFDAYHSGAFFAHGSRFVPLAHFEIAFGHDIVVLGDRLATVGQQALHVVEHLIDLLGDRQRLNMGWRGENFIIGERWRGCRPAREEIVGVVLVRMEIR